MMMTSILPPNSTRTERALERQSMRLDAMVLSPRAAGTRTSGLRFFSDHAIAVGASWPGTSRLYEFTSGFVIAQ